MLQDFQPSLSVECTYDTLGGFKVQGGILPRGSLTEKIPEMLVYLGVVGVQNLPANLTIPRSKYGIGDLLVKDQGFVAMENPHEPLVVGEGVLHVVKSCSEFSLEKRSSIHRSQCKSQPVFK